MATRCLTVQFIGLRNALKGSCRVEYTIPISEELPLRTNAQSSDNLSSTPRWIETLDHVKDYQEAMKNKMSHLKELHATRLRPFFGKDETKEDRIIEAVTGDINKLFKDGEKAIRTLVESEGDTTRRSPDEQKLLQNVKLSLVTQMNSLSKSFRDEQRKFLTEMHKQKIRAEKLTSFGKYSEEEENEKGELIVQQYVEKGFTEEQIDAVMLNREMIAQRDADFQKIYSSIVDLHEIFKDLNSLVLDQGTLLDRIDYNVEETKRQICKANEELAPALKYQKRSRFLLLVLVLVVFIIVMAMALAVKIMI